MGYIDLLEKKAREKELLRKKALQEAEHLSTLLKEKFEFESLFLIGSVIKEKGFHHHSDIDFVIKGLKTESFFKALSLLISNSTFDIDLKPYKELDQEHRMIVEKEGRVL